MSRPLGWLEKYMHTVPKCNVIISSQIEGGQMDAAKFEQAVKATACRHPQLRSIIDKETLAFVELDSFVPGHNHYQVIDTEDPEEWRSVADQECNLATGMYGANPLWKITLIRTGASNVMLVKFHHCIGDGSSGYIITNDILTFYQRLEESGDIGDVEPLPRLDSADSMALSSLPGDPSDEEIANQLQEDFIRRRCEWSPSAGLPFDRKVGGQHNTTLYKDGSAESSAALLSLCRKKGITMGPVLVAATYFAIAKMDTVFCARVADDPSAEFSFDFDMDVNLRKRLSTVLGNDHVGNIIGMMSFSLKLRGDTKFWDFAARVRTAMTNFLDSKLHFHYFGVNERFDAMADSLPFFQDNLSRNDGLVQDMNFSSFGKYFYDPNYGTLQITKMYAIGGGWCPTFGSCVFLILGLSRNHYTFVYSTSPENAVVAESFFEKAVGIIEIAQDFDDAYCLGNWLSS